MFRYPRRREFDIEPFKKESPPHGTLYGLPEGSRLLPEVRDFQSTSQFGR